MLGLLLAVFGVGSVLGTTVHELSFEAKYTLLQFSAKHDVKTVDQLIPLYRKDLYPSYEAYWQMNINDDEYLVISSGADTEDYRIVMQGRLPSPTDHLDARAKELGKSCHKYFMLAPGGIVMCENEAGRIVATSHDPFIDKTPLGADVTYTERHRFLEGRQAILKQHWNSVKSNVSHIGVWNTSGFYYNYPWNTFFGKMPARNRVEFEEGVGIGDAVRVPVDAGSKARVKYVTHDFIKPDTQRKQEELCKSIKICSDHDIFDIDHSKLETTPYGITYVTISPKAPILESISFQLEILKTNGRVAVKRFGLDLVSRHARQTVPSSMAIPDESYFPEYDQHMYTAKHCYVGCGPVSWAMIFGYFDRRSHGNAQKYGTQSQALWRCGPTGNEGDNSCVAPDRNTETLKRYTEHLNGIMGTFCLGDQGATPQWKMDDAKDYFVQRMAGAANPTIEAHHDWLLSDVGIYEDKFRDNMVHFIQSGWPTVIGIRISGVFSQHYPVAARYRIQTTRSRQCITGSSETAGPTGCAQFRTANEYDMYLHMGWGGSKNGWRKAETFFAAAAKYDLPTAG